jgi:hypothetical protein
LGALGLWLGGARGGGALDGVVVACTAGLGVQLVMMTSTGA